MMSPDFRLADDERYLLNLIADGYNHAEIAALGDDYAWQVSYDVACLYQRIGAINAPHAIALAIRSGNLPDEVSRQAASEGGPNAVLPCGTDSARRRHLAHTERCAICGVDGVRIPAGVAAEWLGLPRGEAA